MAFFLERNFVTMLSKQQEDLEKLKEAIEAEKKWRERQNHNLLEDHMSAVMASLSRMSDSRELPFIQKHYDAILQLNLLRREGVSEEDIAKNHMNFDEDSGKGWLVPIYDSVSKERVIWRYSPYYIAIMGFSFSEMHQALDEAFSEQRDIPGCLPLLRIWEPSEEPWNDAVYRDAQPIGIFLERV